MIKYLVLLLDDTSVSFCHYNNAKALRKLMPLDTLKESILYGMKENLNIQLVYPDYELPQEYKDVIDTIDHTDIKPASQAKNSDVVVMNSFDCKETRNGKTYVIRTSKADFFANVDKIGKMLEYMERLNIVLTDIEKFTNDDISVYSNCLATLSNKVEQLYVAGKALQLNVLTDRMMLDKMNNCGAGDTTITIAPDGNFYVCPAFYHACEEDYGLGNAKFSVGDLKQGLDIKNPQLYKLEYAPLCRHCDAYHCRRCVWLNRKTTYEVNTPSHEQCVVAHVERNASLQLLNNIRKHGVFLPDKEDIKEIDYLDPFDVKKEW